MRIVVPVFALAVTLSGCGSLNYYGDPNKGDGTPSDGSDPTTPTHPNPGGDDDDDATIQVDTGTPPSTSPTTPSTSTTTTTGSTTVPFQPAVTSVSPGFGSNLGGEAITIEGAFDHSTTITVDGVAAVVTSQTSVEITAIVPASAVTGWVEVEADNGSKTAKLKKGFEYWDDGTGQAGTFGWMSYFHLLGGYWKGNPGDSASAAFGFLVPSDWTLQSDYSPTLDTCQFNYAVTAQTMYNTGASDVQLTTGATTVTLNRSPAVGTGGYGEPALVANTDVIPGATYDLTAVAGNGDWPSFAIPNVVDMPPAFNVTSPDMDKPVNPPDVARGMTVTWSGSGGDYMLLFMLRQKAVSGNDDGVVTCVMADDGSFTVPSGVWPDWTKNEFLHIEVGRVYEASSILPHNNAENRMPGIYWNYGGGNAN